MTPIDIEYYFWTALLIISVLCSIEKKKELDLSTQTISLDTSVTLKAVCCIIIILHHYGLRNSSNFLSNILATGGGSYTLPIFLCLSSYGIAISELKTSTGTKTFFSKRISKIIIPYIIVMLLTIISYWIIEAKPSYEEMIANRINTSFAYIGSHKISWVDVIEYLLGIKSLCGSMWFVGVTMYSYFTFYICKNCYSLTKQKKQIFILYAFLILIFGFIAYKTNAPGHYYRNLWALILGFHFAIYQGLWIGLSKSKKISIFVLINRVSSSTFLKM